jgi:membrane-bound lytic murein transglycosylase D
MAPLPLPTPPRLQVTMRKALVLLLLLTTAPVLAEGTTPAPAAAQTPPEAEDAVPAAAAEVPAPGAEEPTEADEEAVESESAELEEMRALEAAALDPAATPNAEVLQSLHRLGLANPLRQRMLDALEEPTFREDDAPPELPLITDLSSFDTTLVQSRYDIPVEMQPLVAQYIQFFQGSGRRWFRRWVSRSTRFIPVMQPILESHGLPRDTVYLAMIESGFSAHAYSWAHAAGPWQFISSTGRQYGLRQDFWVDERRDPIKATVAAARYLRDLHRELGHWYLAWAGYNTGGGRVRRLVERLGTSNFWTISEGPGLAKETKHYVPKLIAAALIAKHPQAFGFSESEFDYEPTLEYEEVQLTEGVDLDVAAQAAGVSVTELQDLNPELRRWCTPPASKKDPYTLRVPKGSGEQFAQKLARVGPKERLAFRVHKVRRGDTLSGIASGYGSAPEAIMQMNRLASARRLRPGTELVIPVPAGRGGREPQEDALARKVAQARRSGVVAARPEEEEPASTPPTSAPVNTAPFRTEKVGGRIKVTYTVREGDSLWAVAQRFKVSVEDLRKWNKLSRYQRGLRVGKELYLWPEQAPAGAAVAQRQGPRGGRTVLYHELAAGETLWGVAQRYGIAVEDLMRWNQIKDHRSVQAGSRLVLAAP